MAYSIKRKVSTGFPKQDWSIADAIQNKINRFLYEIKEDEGLKANEPKLLTIIVKKDKEHYFHFLRDETEFSVKGKWQEAIHKPSRLLAEENIEINIQYLDNKKGTITRKLKNLLKGYNQEIVKEKEIYVTSTPLQMTSLDLARGR